MLSNIVAYEWPLDETKQVAFIAGDDHIHEMMTGQKGRWRDDDLSELAGAPALALEMAIMTGYAWSDGRTKQIAYVSPVDGNGHIHELVIRQGNTWSYTDLMDQLPGAPAADGVAIAGYAWKANGTKQVVYTGSDSHIHEIMVGVMGMWAHSDLTQLTGAPEASNELVIGYEWTAQFAKQVVYLDTRENPHIHELMLKHGGSWHHTDLTRLTDAPELV